MSKFKIGDEVLYFDTSDWKHNKLAIITDIEFRFGQWIYSIYFNNEPIHMSSALEKHIKLSIRSLRNEKLEELGIL